MRRETMSAHSHMRSLAESTVAMIRATFRHALCSNGDVEHGSIVLYRPAFRARILAVDTDSDTKVDTDGQGTPTGDNKGPYTGHKLFEQYQLIVEETARISDRRHSTNNLFLSVNSVLLGAVALLIQQGVGRGAEVVLFLYLAFLLVGAGMVLCVLWRQLLTRYGERLRRRFRYLRKLERQYPDILVPATLQLGPIPTTSTQKGQGKKVQVKRQRKENFTLMEARVPFVFLVTYAFALMGAAVFVLSQFTPLPTQLLHQLPH